jgi:O-antigen/teichoic acid export membrane protein
VSTVQPVSGKRAAMWGVAGQLAFLSIQLAGQVIVTRILNPYEMGIYAAALATTGLIAVMQAFGLNSLLVRERTLRPELVATVITVNIVINCLVAAAILIASIGLSGWFNDPRISQVLILLTWLPLIGIVEFVPSAFLQRDMKFKVIALITTGRALLTTCVTVTLAYGGFSYMSMPYGALAGAVLSALLFNIVGREHVTWRLGLSQLGYVLRFGLQVTAISGINQLASRVSVLVLGRVRGLPQLGYYSRADTMINIIWDNIHGVMAKVLISGLARQLREGSVSLRDTYPRIVEVVTAALWPPFAGIAVLSGPLIHVVFGDKWLPAALPLSVLALSLSVMMVSTFAWEIFIVCGETRAQSRLELIRAPMSAIFFCSLCFFGITAAACGRMLDAILSQFLYLPRILKMTGTSMGVLWPVYRRSLLLTGLAITPATLLMSFNGWPAIISTSWMIAVILAGVIAWSAALIRLRHPLWMELRALAKAG